MSGFTFEAFRGDGTNVDSFTTNGAGTGSSDAAAAAQQSSSAYVYGGTGYQQALGALTNQYPGLNASSWNPDIGDIGVRLANNLQSHFRGGRPVKNALKRPGGRGPGGNLRAARPTAARGPCTTAAPSAANSFASTAQTATATATRNIVNSQVQPRDHNHDHAHDHGHVLPNGHHPTPVAPSNEAPRESSVVARDRDKDTSPPDDSLESALENKMSLFGKPATAAGGGLSINTGAANAGAGPSSTPAAGGLFGNTTAPAQPATGGLFGGNTGTQASGGLFGNKPSTPATGGLFGSSTATSQPQQTGGGPGGGLFGAATTATAQPQQQTTGMFGQANALAQTNTAQGGLFGTPAQQQTNQQQTQQPSGGLFGASQQQKPATGGLFGGGATQTQTQQPATGGLFGGGNTQTPQAQGAGGGLFGQSQAQNQTQNTGGLFGKTMQQNSTAPGLTMGQSTAQQTVPGVRVDISNVKGTTRFNDLEQSLQTEMENCDLMIQRFMAHASEIKGFMAAHGGDLAQLTNDVNWLQRKYEGVKTTLDEDIVTLAHVKDLVKSDADIAKMAFAGADQLKLPAHYHQTWLSRGGPAGHGASSAGQDRSVEDVLTLFSNEADRLKELHTFQVQKIKEMEQHMPGVEHGLYERVRALRDQTQVPAFNMVLDLLETIKMMGDKIYEAADGIVDVREKLTTLQRQYPAK